MFKLILEANELKRPPPKKERKLGKYVIKKSASASFALSAAAFVQIPATSD